MIQFFVQGEPWRTRFSMRMFGSHRSFRKRYACIDSRICLRTVVCLRYRFVCCVHAVFMKRCCLLYLMGERPSVSCSPWTRMVGAYVCAWLLRNVIIRSTVCCSFNKEVSHNPCNETRTLSNGGRYVRNSSVLLVSAMKSVLK